MYICLLQSPFTPNFLFEILIMMTSPPTYNMTDEETDPQKLWLTQVHTAHGLGLNLTPDPFCFTTKPQADAPSPKRKRNPELRGLITFYKRYASVTDPAAAWEPPVIGQSAQLLCAELGPGNLTPYKIHKSEHGLRGPQRDLSPAPVSPHLEWWAPILTTLYSS